MSGSPTHTAKVLCAPTPGTGPVYPQQAWGTWATPSPSLVHGEGGFLHMTLFLTSLLGGRLTPLLALRTFPLQCWSTQWGPRK